MRGIRYKEQTKQVCNQDKSMCTDQPFLDPQPLWTQDGDKTVVIPSAVAMGGDEYYLDLPDYNDGLRRNRDHADILEATSTRSLIEKIIFGDTSVLPNHIYTDKPPVTDPTKRLRADIY